MTNAESARAWFLLRPRPKYRWTRTVLLHALSFIYFVAFLILVEQHAPLLGSNGLLPVRVFTAHVTDRLGSTPAAFWRLPSLFWFGDSDATLAVCASIRLVLSLFGCLGFGNALVFGRFGLSICRSSTWGRSSTATAGRACCVGPDFSLFSWLHRRRCVSRTRRSRHG